VRALAFDNFYSGEPDVHVDFPSQNAKNASRIVDLDVDIGADAVDYKYVFLSVALRYLIDAFLQRHSKPGVPVSSRNRDAQA
jgi:hypothetical protein